MINRSRLLRILLLPVAVLIVLGVRWIRPLYLIRFGALYSARIGHLAGNTEIYLGECDIGIQPKGRFGRLDLWTHVGDPCNMQLATMISRSMIVDTSGFVKLLFIINKQFHGWEKHTAGSDNWDRDIHDALHKTRQHIQFTPEEIAIGEKQLADWGLKPGDRWVCLIARDAAYLPAEFSYHSYRDVKIGSYKLAAVALADRGYHVFRMGAKVQKPFDIEHPMIADYATNGMRSDFMDIFLTAHCEFAISNGTGLDSIPVIFRRPVCYVNYVPIEYLITWAKGLSIWKHHYRNGKRMTLLEIFDCGAGQFMRSDLFEKNKITLRDNTAKEIKDAVMEMCDMVENKNNWHKQDFWSRFPVGTITNETGKPLHGEVRMRIGSKFLESYK